MSEQILPLGYEFEQKVFGRHANWDEDGDIYNGHKKNFRRWREEAISRAVGEGWNPSDPGEGLLISVLLEKVREALQKRKMQDYPIEVWPSVGTRFDYLHGIDGFFRIKMPGYEAGKYMPVYYHFDLSINQSKSSRKGVDILSERNFGASLWHTALHIVETLQYLHLVRVQNLTKRLHLPSSY